MRCSASPTTCIAEPAPRAALPRAEAAAPFTSLLLAMVLRPLAKPLGFYGEVVVDACAQSIARSFGELPGARR
jgi:hypothetical protein